jgi:hypothetical protein
MGCATALASIGGLAQQATGGLRIVVVEGEDAVNIIQQRTAVAPLVEVRDRNNNPVAGALVTFSIQGGQNATFGGGLQSVIVTTNAAGRAAVTGLTPTASGAVQINVAATFQGQAATATITQTNFATAAQAAQAGASSAGTGGGSGGGSGSTSAGSASGGGGGGISTTTIAAIVGGAGAGTYFGLKELGVIGVPDIPPPIITSASAFPPGGLVGMLFDFNFSGEVSGNVERPDATMLWEFGDGASNTSSVGGPAPPTRVTHVYAAPGTYTARVTITNADGESATAQTTVVVKTLTGRWRVGTGATFYDFTQTAATFSGSFNSGTAVVRSLSGTVNASFPIIRFTESNGASFTGNTVDADTISGTFTGPGTQSGTVLLFRQ